jgi:decaprenylphospho-beta-D-erythro-pentofuranosid-2-ulose 2-reductase
MARRVVVFGATSTIATEVAAIWAARGDRLCLVGRSRGKLDALAGRLASAQPLVRQADFDDLGGNEAVVEGAIASLGGCDVALIAHGLLGDQGSTEREFGSAEQVIRTNFTSVVSLLVPLANHFESARTGRLGVITSVAGERGRPRNYTYGAAKGALNLYLQGLRSRLVPAQVTVTTLKLGPVDTPMTATHEKNPLFSRPGPVARRIAAAVDAGRFEVFVPGYWRAIMLLVRHAPEAVFQLVRGRAGI